jgi:hypothetical protein
MFLSLFNALSIIKGLPNPFRMSRIYKRAFLCYSGTKSGPLRRPVCHLTRLQIVESRAWHLKLLCRISLCLRNKTARAEIEGLHAGPLIEGNQDFGLSNFVIVLAQLISENRNF